MSKVNKATNEFQQNFNRYLEGQVQKVFGPEIGPGFRAFQHNSDFNYFTFDGLSYNLLSLHCLDSLLKQDAATGEFSLEEGGFSRLYCNVLRASRYMLSQATQTKVNDALLKYSAQAVEVIKHYPGMLPPLQSAKMEDRIFEIYANCAEAFHGDVTKNCDIIPDSLRSFKLALQALNNVGDDAAQMVMEVGNKNAVLSNIVKNLEKPSADNAGLPVGGDGYYVGYDKIPMPQTLLDSLSAESNALTITVSGETYNSSEMNVHIDNQANFRLPFNLFMDLHGEHTSDFDMQKLKTDQTNFEASITYSGLTKVPIQPMPASIIGDKGWYAESTILSEIREKSQGTDSDGYKLNNSEFKVDELFGKKLAYLKALLVSKMPTISITLTNINTEYAHSVFTMENDVTLTLFGFIKVGHHHNYKTEDVSFNDDEASVSLTFQQPPASGTPDPETSTAFVMGGVPYYPGMN